jgi:hypothetical protein
MLKEFRLWLPVRESAESAKVKSIGIVAVVPSGLCIYSDNN